MQKTTYKHSGLGADSIPCSNVLQPTWGAGFGINCCCGGNVVTHKRKNCPDTERNVLKMESSFTSHTKSRQPVTMVAMMLVE